jgi:hypothetical protein
MSHNPVAYVTPNGSSVVEPTSDLDSSCMSFVSNMIPPLAAVVAQSPMESAPLHIPRFSWRCLVSRTTNEFPIIFNALIDHGSSAVLISEEYVSKLGLCRKRLLKPYSAKLAMESNGQKVNIEFSEYVKVALHDPSSY